MKKLTQLQREIFESRYALPTEQEWTECTKRVANHIVQAESPDKQAEILQEFLDILDPMYFVPGGRVLYGSGRSKQQLLNCFAFHVEDNARSIGKLLNDVYITSVSFGGCGVNYSAIRPKGDPLQNVKGQAPGVISEMRKIDCIGNEVKAGGARRAALIGLLSVSHPDVLEFLHVKLALKELTNHNISIVINDDFLKAARKKQKWTFKFGGRTYLLWNVERTWYDLQSNQQLTDVLQIPAIDEEDALIRADVHYRHVGNETDEFVVTGEYEMRADELLEILANNACNCGEPGIINESLIKRNMATRYFEEFASVNPCTEAVLPHHGNCCLGSLNLSELYDPDTNDVNWRLLARTIRIAVRFLDNVLSVNEYPLPSMREVSHGSRRIGLGVMGLGYLYIKMGLKYGSSKALEFTDRLMKTIRDEAFAASIQLSKEKGAFTKFDPDKYLENDFIESLPPDIQEDIREFGIRNAVILSIAPTGTISMLAGCSSGIEPVFAPVYKRRFRKGGTIVERIVVDPLFKEAFLRGDDTSCFVGSHDVSAEGHMRTIARIQKYIDQSISKTTNVAENSTAESIAKYILKYAPHIKGWTIYREGSRQFDGAVGSPMESMDVTAMSRDSVLELIHLSDAEAAVVRCAGGCDV